MNTSLTHYETLRCPQSSVPFGEGFASTVPVFGMPTSVSRMVSLSGFLSLACQRIPGFSVEVGSLTCFLLNDTLLIGPRNSVEQLPMWAPWLCSEQISCKKILHLFPMVLILFSFPTALFFHQCTPLPKANVSFCPSYELKLVGKLNQRRYMPEGTWSLREERWDISFNSIWIPTQWGNNALVG